MNTPSTTATPPRYYGTDDALIVVDNLIAQRRDAIADIDRSTHASPQSAAYREELVIALRALEQARFLVASTESI